MESIWDISDDHKFVSKSPGFNSSMNIEIQYADMIIKPPLPAESFEEVNLDKNIVEGLNWHGIFKPNGIQRHLLPLLLDQHNDYKRNFVVCASEGSGKTTSALLATLNGMAWSNAKSSRALMICPRCDMAKKTFDMGESMAKGYRHQLGFHHAVRKNEAKKESMIAERIVIGTPEKIDVIITKALINVKNVEIVVLDDIQLMLRDMAHQKALFRILKALSPCCQMISFSSNRYDEAMNKFLESIGLQRHCPYIVQFPIIQKRSTRVREFFIACEGFGKKIDLLKFIVRNRELYGEIAVICRDRATVENVYECLAQDGGLSAAYLFGKMKPVKRESIIKDFIDKDIMVLVTTPNFMDSLQKATTLRTVINFDHYLSDSHKYELEMETYRKSMGVMEDCAASVLINLIEDRCAGYVLDKSKKNINIVDEDELKTALIRMYHTLWN